MAKRQSAAQQAALFKREIPEMPEGYYSSGPNPNLRRFVEEHATPYDPETDDYAVPPFDQPITTTKTTTIYNMHSYQGKKPHDAIRRYVRHYTQPGDLVLDAMCGSGSTALATLIEGRAATAIDLSPSATLITRGYCTPTDAARLQRAFRELRVQVKPEMQWLYETRCDRCDGLATMAYMVHSYVFQCPRCLEMLPLFDCVKAMGHTAQGKPKKITVCPYCYAKEHVEEISTRSQRFEPVPVLVSYFCEEGCSPKRDTRQHNDHDPKKLSYFDKYDLGKLREIEATKIPHWTPDIPMIKGYETTIKRNLEAQGIHKVDDLFTKRNLWALAALLSEAGDDDDLRLMIQASILASSRRAQHLEGGGGYIPGSYHLPQMSKERNVLGVLERIAKKVMKARSTITKQLRSTSLVISTETATSLARIPSDSIDYIFTDPPYGGSVQYGELNFIWEAWMGFDTSWHEQEIIVNSVRGRTEADWARMMKQAFQEYCRVLKPGRWISVCYHDTSEGTWQLMQDLMSEAGFISEQLDSVLSIDTGGRTYNQYTASKVTKRDLVINFRKPRPGELVAQLTLFGDEDATTFSGKARTILSEALNSHPGSPADRLYDELVSRMVRKGEFERHNFDQLLRGVAEEVNGRWYLLDTADQVDEAESAKEGAAAARLEAFMMQHLAERPEESGVHYSDLFEQYLPLQDKPRRLLADWLPEHFFKTPEGTWRPPADDEERAQKEALRTSGTLRRIKRFGRALLEGVPPHDRDRPSSAATAADWLRQCRRAGLYDLGRALYEKGGFRFDELSDEGQLEVEEDYQICVRRS